MTQSQFEFLAHKASQLNDLLHRLEELEGRRMEIAFVSDTWGSYDEELEQVKNEISSLETEVIAFAESVNNKACTA